MVRIEKRYFDLDEVSARWRLRIRDLGYLAENGDLRVSTRLEGAHLERGIIEIERGQEFRIPHEQEWFSGIIDLQRRDAFRIFRYGVTEVVHFHAEDDEYAAVIEPTSSVEVHLDHLVVRRDERDRVEAVHKSAGQTVAEGEFHLEVHRLKQIGSRRPCQAPRGTPRPGIGSRGICAG
jgi:hypothetical protein